MTRRVRVTDSFRAALRAALPDRADRPSWRDFEKRDLAAVEAKFAEQWDDLAELIVGRPDYRQDIGVGTCGAYVVEAQLAGDGVIELVAVRVDVDGLADPGED